ncbi:Pol protein [Phytophthora cinnamomi]|uniref:Pol protein n=1 Tax=Phytophthora cinnamomi TaxID=4785 RepID=UPI00355A8D4A|nr:Pol protein [Phytophthora cinnamomi]
MTIGRDLMGALGLVIDFKNGRITWDGELVVRTTEHGPAAQDNAMMTLRSMKTTSYAPEMTAPRHQKICCRSTSKLLWSTVI